MSSLFKQLAIPAVGVGVGLEDIYKTLKGGETKTYDETMADLKTQSPLKRTLRVAWTLTKVAVAVTKVVLVVRHLRK